MKWACLYEVGEMTDLGAYPLLQLNGIECTTAIVTGSTYKPTFSTDKRDAITYLDAR